MSKILTLKTQNNKLEGKKMKKKSKKFSISITRIYSFFNANLFKLNDNARKKNTKITEMKNFKTF